jgi:hypothetical protein
MDRSEEHLALARSIQLTPSREGLRAGCPGAIAAERHPTGWFISACFDPGLASEHVEDFVHFVTGRVYLLLEHGPQPEAWEADPAGFWRAHYPASGVQADDLLLIA